MCIRTSIVLLLTLIGHFGSRIKSGNFLVLKKLSSHKLVLKSPNKEAYKKWQGGDIYWQSPILSYFKQNTVKAEGGKYESYRYYHITNITYFNFLKSLIYQSKHWFIFKSVEKQFFHFQNKFHVFNLVHMAKKHNQQYCTLHSQKQLFVKNFKTMFFLLLML